MKKRRLKKVIKSIIISTNILFGNIIIANFYPGGGHPPIPWREYLMDSFDTNIVVVIIFSIFAYIYITIYDISIKKSAPLNINRIIYYCSRLIAIHLLAIKDITIYEAYQYICQNIGLLIIMLYVYTSIIYLRYHLDYTMLEEINKEDYKNRLKTISMFIFCCSLYRIPIILLPILYILEDCDIHSKIIITRTTIAFLLLIGCYVLDWRFFMKNIPTHIDDASSQI